MGLKLLNHRLLKQAILIRLVEQEFLSLFSAGKLNGTVHTCVGQEFSALAFAGQLKKSDFVFSNHRCHGHYISFTHDWKGLIAELLGKKSGTCGGIGSSQHLCQGNFFSNGIQGGIVPIAAGFALANKLKRNNSIGVVYIGDGTLGEGVVYETMNIISKWNIPLIIVCENNLYAQSTSINDTLAGDILDRAKSFGIHTFKSDTWDIDTLFRNASESIDYSRKNCKPVFHLVDTYRLNAHSKGDDTRNKEEIVSYQELDILSRLEKYETETYERYATPIKREIIQYIDQIQNDEEITIDEYCKHGLLEEIVKWNDLVFEESKRQVDLINEFFHEAMSEDKRIIFIGEDVLSPYGGAFKVAKNLSSIFPEQVFSTPISEAAIIGLSNGLALNNMKPFSEIMFGDFILLGLDQIVNHAAKFHHMYNFKVNCPMVVRTPMGGRRGYGPTHSQSLEKFLIGIDNISVVALNQFINPKLIYKSIHEQNHPVVVVENKVDYGKKNQQILIEDYKYEISNHSFPVLRIRPVLTEPEMTLITFGGLSEVAINSLNDIFYKFDYVAQVLILTAISPIDFELLQVETLSSDIIITLEEGSLNAGVGSEIIAGLSERCKSKIFKRIASFPVPVPSCKNLENIVIPSKERLLDEISQIIQHDTN